MHFSAALHSSPFHLSHYFRGALARQGTWNWTWCGRVKDEWVRWRQDGPDESLCHKWAEEEQQYNNLCSIVIESLPTAPLRCTESGKFSRPLDDRSGRNWCMFKYRFIVISTSEWAARKRRQVSTLQMQLHYMMGNIILSSSLSLGSLSWIWFVWSRKRVLGGELN